MNLSVYLTGLILASLVAGACLTAILIYFNPDSSGFLIFTLFYLSLFIGSTAIFTLIGLLIRRIPKRRSASQAVRQLEISFRQGLLLSMILIVALILQSQRVLAWWNVLALVSAIGLAEWWLAKR
jgi:hypothetical protein